MKQLKTNILLAVLAGAVVAVPLQGIAQDAPLAAGLQAPRGLSVSGDALLVAAQGDGRILSIAADGTATPLIEGIVTGSYNSPEGPTIVGVNAAIQVGDTVFFTVGGSLGSIAGSEAVYASTNGEAPRLLANLGQYEIDNNTGGDLNMAGEPDIDSNPYDLVSDGADGVYVTDAAANSVFHVSADGTIHHYAFFPDRENPLFGTVGGPTFDPVPTGMTVGPDGALYVATLTGFPFPASAAQILRLEDANGDGDALDEGEVTVAADGLTATTDVAFAADGSLLVTEFSTDFLAQAPGRLVRVADGAITEIAGVLVSPTGVAVRADGSIAVAQEFAGIVVALPAAE